MTDLVLLPGLLCDDRLWGHQAETLADVARVHIADLTRHTSIADMADDVLANAPETFALAGLSMGGYVAMEILRRAPGRVERVALLDTTARPDGDEQKRRRKGLIELSAMGKFKGVTPKLLPLLIHPDRQEDPWLTSTVMKMAEHVGQDAFQRQQTAIMGRIDSRPSLKDVRCPALVLCGRQDAITPLPVAEEMAGLMEQARLVVVEDCGHLASLEQPHAVSAVMRYWLQS
jgi:pimeloyl-ACP methyl ester carboxylesterase